MLTAPLIRSFANAGPAAPGRAFPGFTQTPLTQTWDLAPRQSRRIDMKPGDLLSVTGLTDEDWLSLMAFDARGHDMLGALGLTADAGLGADDYDSVELTGWLNAQGATASPARAKLRGDGEIAVVKTDAACTLWAIRDVPARQLVHCAAPGPLRLSRQPATNSAALLPPPLGEVRDEFTVSRATAQAYALKKGEIVQIIDVEGQQCSDFMAFRAQGLDQGLEQMIDSTVTRSVVGGAYPTPGLFDKFLDADMRPLLNLMQDTVGRHDTFALACTARGYEERGFPGHVNCSDNISDAMAPYGVQRRVAWPAINFFFNSWIDRTDNRIQSEESWSRAGDYVALKAMDDLVCVSTACPDDIDPINGWNPTDVHVRIYRPDAPIRRAVAYREKEDAPVSISQESAFHPRLSHLTQQFAPARDLWTPVSFPSTGTLGEYWACRNAVTLQDMSGLRKFDVVGPDAERLLQLAMTRDISKLSVWRGTYALMCDAQGTVIDDGTLFRLGEGLFRWCCGSEESGRALDALATEHGLQVRIKAMRSALPNLALQGPNSRDLLREIVFTQPHVPALDDIRWFGVTMARLKDREGLPFMLSRSGYTGELGYELFCAASDAVPLWDALMEAGQPYGIKPMGSAALETIRIEAGLAASHAEFAPGIDAFEAGLGFAVDLNKSDFTGKDALTRNARDPRRVLKGLLLECDDVPAHGSPVLAGEREVGIVTSATRSPSLERAIAMARLSVEHATDGMILDIGQMDGRMKRLSATVTSIPFIDPQRKRARA
ncbi:DUF1989 domain-containing protein [Thalassococcus sp. S3]|uniref:DUF1989 domain-containing protein n=1 Tax=Thalassococcus sp. S3 TaxID=2017482 RepID=UPI00102438BE|nr:aminomethyltransferase family protein [Thalassococcus sp. S3]QBF30903.1 aminomethyltransferase [Thalassococcus sp. S3]